MQQSRQEAKNSKQIDSSHNPYNYLKWRKRFYVCTTLIALSVLVVIAVNCLSILSNPVSIIIWTVIIVFLLRNVVNALDKKGVNRVLGTAIAYLIMFAVLGVILFFMFSPAFGINEQIKDIISNIPSLIESVKEWVKELYSQYGRYLENENVQKWLNEGVSSLGSFGSDIATAGAAGIVSFGGAFGNFLMNIGFALVVAFWILIELPKIGRETRRFIKPKYKQDANLWYYTFTHVMAGYIKGTVLQCAIIGVASGLLYWACGLHNPGAMGCITGFLNIIPIIGPWIGGIAAGIAGVLAGNMWSCIIAIAGTIAIQQFVYTFISPAIMSQSVDIHPALSLLALTVGAAIGGAMSGVIGSLVGMLLSIPAVAVFKALFVYYYEKNTGVRIVSEDGVFFKGKPKDTEKAHPLYDATSFDHKKHNDDKNQKNNPNNSNKLNNANTNAHKNTVTKSEDNNKQT